MPNRTIYALDDDAGFRSSLHAIADALGIRCQSFETKEALLAIPTLFRPGCLVLDHSLQAGLKGVDVLESLDSVQWRIPIIICTAHATVPLAVQYMRAGAISFVEKPLQGRLMASQILEAIERDSCSLQLELTYQRMRNLYERLTPRQRTILGMMSESEIYKCIADRLDISRRTLDIEKAVIYRTLEVESQMELGIWITRLLSLHHSLNMKGGFPDLQPALTSKY